MQGIPYISEFSQEGPRIGNQYLEDWALQRYLKFFLSASELKTIENDLIAFGDKTAGKYLEQARLAEVFPPIAEPYDAWGNRINRLYISEGWKYFHRESAIEGLVAIPYESKLHANSRVFQATKLFMGSPAMAFYGCPLAMADGAAFVLKKKLATGEYDFKDAKESYEKLTTRDPDAFITSGQWMTEKRGGSDVRMATETIAIANEEKQYYDLHGFKWFTSATDSQITLALGKIVPKEAALDVTHAKIKAQRPSLFLLKIQKENELGETVLNDIEIVRMKNKAGTKQLPTAELLLRGSKALLISKPEEGIKDIVGMLHITRYHNGIAAVAGMRRIIHLGVDYAFRRVQFRAKLSEKPLHLVTLNQLEMDTRGNLIFVLEMSRLLGKIDVDSVTNDELQVFRLCSSLLKLFTGKEVTRVTSEGIELFGGIGMMENSFIPGILRDSQVLPIWEGTTNLLSLDFLKAVAKDMKGWSTLVAYLKDLSSGNEALEKEVGLMIKDVTSFMKNMKEAGVAALEGKARVFAFNTSRLLIAGLANKVKKANDSEFTKQDCLLVDHWVRRVQRENEQLCEKNIDVLGLEELFGNEMGKTKDSRGKLRSRY